MSDNKKIEVVSGNGKNLKISPVYEHIEIEKPKSKTKKDTIVIPKVKKDDKNK